ncbi:MAG: hypothetical protein MJZ30_06135 [Paludibacteraceae bacterium]|nr:hypothetical protein [Paludibacteraceae bacterium]
MDYAKSIIVSIVTGVVAYLKPIDGEIFSLALVFVLNFFVGMFADFIVNNEGFKFRKAWRCIVEMTVFFVLVTSIYIFGKFKGRPDGALQCVSFVTYTVSYFYSVNCLRNLRVMFKNQHTAYMVFSFLYHVVSLEMVKKIPFLADFIKSNYKESDNTSEA